MNPPTMLGLALTLAAKDWRLFQTDRRAVLFTFATPILLATAFGFMLDGVIAPPYRSEAAAVGGSGKSSFNSFSHSFCGMTLLCLLFLGLENGLSLLRERKGGLGLRLAAAPVPLSAVVLGKAIFAGLISLGILVVTFAFGSAAFGVTVQSRIGFALLAVAAGTLAPAVGILIATIGSNEARARGLGLLAILGVSMLGGLVLPWFLLPGWLRDASLVLPTTWAMRGFEAVTWQGSESHHVLKFALIVASFAAVLLFAATVRLGMCDSRRRRGLIAN